MFQFRRCVLLNGIDVGALRGDLTDRIVMINLDRIGESARLTERKLNARWDAAYPSILGGLLTLAAGTMRALPSVRLASSPRMADFARVLAAIDEVCETGGLARFAEQARTMAEDSLSSDPFLAAMDEAKVDFEGRSAELLVKARPDVDGWRAPKDWPKDARSVTSLLKRNAPAMRKAGWVVEYSVDAHTGVTEWTVIHPEKAGNSSLQSLQSQQDAGNAGSAGNENGQSQDDPSWPRCRVCGADMWHPESQQRGICHKCHRQTEGRAP